MSYTVVNGTSSDVADAVAQAYASTKNDKCTTTKAHISPNDYLDGSYKLSVGDSVWMDNNTGTVFRAIDMVDCSVMNRYVDELIQC